jgi:nitroreductase
MEFMEVFKGRRSIRRFRPDPVARDLIEEILSESRWCPSWANTQPWEVVVVYGDALEKFKAGQLEKLASQAKAQPDVATPGKFPAKWHERVLQIGMSCLDAERIGKEDKARKNKYFTDMFTLFGAPVMLLFALDKQLDLSYAMLDLGSFMTSVCLVAREKGLGTLIVSTSIHFPDLSRSLFQIPEDKRIVMGVAMGYADETAAINRFERKRVPVSDFVTWRQ